MTKPLNLAYSPDEVPRERYVPNILQVKAENTRNLSCNRRQTMGRILATPSFFLHSFNHRPFAKAEQQEASHWNNRPDKMPWLQDPKTSFKLQCRVPAELADQRLHPTEAQISTLPHYTDPLVQLGK